MARKAIGYLTSPAEPEAVPSGLEIVAVVVERGPERSVLAQALQRIASQEADALFVSRLGDAAHSLGELVRLLEWLDQAGATLIASDVGLNTGEQLGRRLVALLTEIERWEREGGPARRPRGRPGLKAGAPELAERIASLRNRGHSLQAIATTLNAEGVPTPRGGTQWRPSSVQAALGYRRPRPPAPGAPPPGPPGRPPARRGPGPGRGPLR